MATKFPKKIDTETPPPPAKRTGNLQLPVPDAQEVKKPLQFKVAETMFEEFSRRAHEDFGHKKGAKLDLFLEMWRLYQRTNKA